MLLSQIGITPDIIISTEIDESPLKDEKPYDFALRLALSKAKAGYKQKKGIVIAADTIVTLGTRILSKAQDKEEAVKFLELLSGRRHQVITAIAVEYGAPKPLTRVTKTSVSIKRLTAMEIDHYILSGEWIGKAGGYAIQGLAARFVKRINGSYTNVVGLPLFETANLLESIGINIPTEIL